ncbi:MAG: DNA glycosylase AlkZ-like family protein, partial [Phycicoccus sp.]
MEARDTELPTEAAVSWAQALAWRLERQLLEPVGSDAAGPDDVEPVGSDATGSDALESESAAGVIRRLGAVLSMDGSLAELAVRVRRRASRPGELADALAAGSVVQAFAFRGAVHYLAPEDGGVYLALRCAGRQWERSSWVEHYRLRPEDWPDFRAAVRDALAAGPLTVSELGEALAGHRAYRHLRPVFDEGAGTLVKPLTWQGDASIGPSRDGRMTLQRLDTNPRWNGVPPLEEAGPRA